VLVQLLRGGGASARIGGAGARGPQQLPARGAMGCVPEPPWGLGIEALFVQTCPKASIFPISGRRSNHKANSRTSLVLQPDAR
jgi:hypothetical protein